MVTLLVLLSTLTVSDYDADLQRLAEQIAGASDDTERAVSLFRRASLTGDFAHFHLAEGAIDAALRESRSPEALLLRASLNFQLHRLRAAKRDLAKIADHPVARLLAAQIALHEGAYRTALLGYTELLAEKRTWDGLASLAYYRANTGHPEEADELYRQAENELTAKEMRSYAWVELQRGILDFELRRHAEALVHYRRANRAYSGYWLFEEHLAEVLYRLGHADEAVALYRGIVERTRKPEYLSALARIIGRDSPSEGARLDAEADRLYGQQWRLYPEAAGGHLIRELLGRDGADHARLVSLASENARLRPNAEAKVLLARAYLKSNRHADARRLLAEVMQTPWRTVEVAELATALHVSSDHHTQAEPGVTP